MNEERARQGVEHLQSAAIEVIAAVRAFLDVAEAVVRDPAAAASVASAFVESARAATATATAPPPPAPSDAAPASRVRRVRVS